MLLLGVLSPEWDILAGKSKYAMRVHFSHGNYLGGGNVVVPFSVTTDNRVA